MSQMTKYPHGMFSWTDLGTTDTLRLKISTESYWDGNITTMMLAAA